MAHQQLSVSYHFTIMSAKCSLQLEFVALSYQASLVKLLRDASLTNSNFSICKFLVAVDSLLLILALGRSFLRIKNEV